MYTYIGVEIFRGIINKGDAGARVTLEGQRHKITTQRWILESGRGMILDINFGSIVEWFDRYFNGVDILLLISFASVTLINSCYSERYLAVKIFIWVKFKPLESCVYDGKSAIKF